MTQTLTPKAREKLIRTRFARVKQLALQDYRTHALSNQKGFELLRGILEIQRLLPSLQLTSPRSCQLRRQVDGFFSSPQGKRYAAAAKAWGGRTFKPAKKPKVGKRPNTSSLYGKKGRFAMFHARPINSDTRRALGWHR
jgi:hypothetical protein